LWLIPLPYADDIRQFPEQPEAPLTTTDALTDKMRIIMEQLQLPGGVYDPSKYPNPDLQWFYRILQAMALDEDIPTQPVDKTVPRYKQIDKRCGEYIEDYGKTFEEVFAQQSRNSLAVRGKHAAKRRTAEPEDGEKSAKKIKAEPKVKTEGGDGGMTDQEMAALNDQGKMSKTTVVVLKEFLSQRGQSTAGKKQDLIDKVQQYLESKGL
jgi:ATP-dependent DNA helicase 2 subunit 1